MSRRCCLGFFSCLFYLLASSQTGTPTFVRDIAPIVFSKCTPCHHADAIGPMPFTSYREIAAYAKMIGYVTQAGYMPPWRAEPGYRHFSNEVMLTETEITLLADWVAAGAPAGEDQEQAVMPAFPSLPYLTQPDLQIGMSQSFEQYGIYYDQFQTFVLPTDLPADQAIAAIEFVPGNARIVRHCSVAIDMGSEAEREDAWDPRYGYFSFGGWGFVPQQTEWYSWSAGDGPLYFPPGRGKILPAGARLVVHVHYGPTGVKQLDSSYFNLVFASQQLQQPIQTMALLNPYTIQNGPLHIPAGEIKRFHSSVRLPFAIDVYDLTPHSLLLARKWEVYATLPNQRLPIKLLKIKDWDYKWKRTYRLPTPLRLPAGTMLHALVEYDNTASNPYNPISPPIDVTWGKRIYQEMLLLHVGFTAAYETGYREPDHFRILTMAANVQDTLLRFQFQTDKKGAYSVYLQDTEGKVVRQLATSESYPKGQHELTTSLQQLPHGVYAITLRNEADGVSIRRLLVYFGKDTTL